MRGFPLFLIHWEIQSRLDGQTGRQTDGERAALCCGSVFNIYSLQISPPVNCLFGSRARRKDSQSVRRKKKLQLKALVQGRAGLTVMRHRGALTDRRQKSPLESFTLAGERRSANSPVLPLWVWYSEWLCSTLSRWSIRPVLFFSGQLVTAPLGRCAEKVPEFLKSSCGLPSSASRCQPGVCSHVRRYYTWGAATEDFLTNEGCCCRAPCVTAEWKNVYVFIIIRARSNLASQSVGTHLITSRQLQMWSRTKVLMMH